jgi:hypothetical protein
MADAWNQTLVNVMKVGVVMIVARLFAHLTSKG